MILTIEAPAQIPSETVTPLKLSESLRLGAIGTKQAFGVLADRKGRYCAIGSILLARGDDPSDIEAWGDELNGMGANRLLQAAKCCPIVPSWKYDLMWIAITHLNDNHRMPRHKIADLLEEIGR